MKCISTFIRRKGNEKRISTIMYNQEYNRTMYDDLKEGGMLLFSRNRFYKIKQKLKNNLIISHEIIIFFIF